MGSKGRSRRGGARADGGFCFCTAVAFAGQPASLASSSPFQLRQISVPFLFRHRFAPAAFPFLAGVWPSQRSQRTQGVCATDTLTRSARPQKTSFFPTKAIATQNDPQGVLSLCAHLQRYAHSLVSSSPARRPKLLHSFVISQVPWHISRHLLPPPRRPSRTMSESDNTKHVFLHSHQAD